MSKLRILLLGALVPGLLGYWLDRYCESHHWFLMGGSLLGFVVATQYLFSHGNKLRHHEKAAPNSNSGTIRIRTVANQGPARPRDADTIY